METQAIAAHLIESFTFAISRTKGDIIVSFLCSSTTSSINLSLQPVPIGRGSTPMVAGELGAGAQLPLLVKMVPERSI